MRRITAAVLVCLSVVLAGAVSPAATPAPKPTATPAPAATATPAPHKAMPMVVIFPFEASSDIKAGVGENAAQLFVQQINSDGGLDTIKAPNTVKRADYLTYAKSLDADYYVAGYMTPLGDGVSLVEQVVSTRSGTIVYGQTAQIESFQDATAQATAIHDGIIGLEQQISDAYQSAQASATATPMPNNQANLSQGLSGIAGLFHHKGKATPTPAPVKPSKGVLVARVNGSLPQNDLTSATNALYGAMNAHFNTKMTSADGLNMTKAADGICGAQRNNTIATGTASAKVERHGLGSRATYTFVLDVYTCFGAKLAQSTGTGGSLSSAVRSAVDSYATQYPQNG